MITKKGLIFCCDGIFPHSVGGIQRHARLLIENIAKMQPEMEIIVIHSHVGVKCFEYFPNIKEIAVPFENKYQYVINLYLFTKRAYNAILQLPQDYLIYVEGMSLWYGVKHLSNRLIINPHGLESFQTIDWKDKLKLIHFRLFQTLQLRKAKFVISSGGKLSDITEQVIGIPPQKIVVLPNATEIEPHRKYQERSYQAPIIFLFVGRLVSNKGVSDLISAVEILNQKGKITDFKVNIVGNGPLFDTLTQNKIKNIKFWGGVSDEELDNLYKQSDVFILPTLFEGMPTVVLEAMKYSLPILVTDVGATRTMVNEENGMIMEKNNTANIADCMEKFISLTIPQKQNLSLASFKKVTTLFSWENITKQHLELFEKV